MASARFYKRNKVTLSSTQDLTPLETKVGTALAEIETSLPEAKGFQITKAIELPSEEKRDNPAVIMFVPYHLLKTFHTHAKRLYIELEKKLKTTVLLVVARTIQSRWIKVFCS